MYLYTTPGEASLRGPAADDLEGIKVLYSGSSSSSSQASAGCSQASVASGPPESRGALAYLAVSRNAVPNEPRVGDIRGDIIINPDWGLHLVDVNLTMGNLLDVVGDETRAYLAQAKKQ